MPPKPPQVFIRQTQATKNAAVAKDSKQQLAIAKVDLKIAAAQNLLKRAALDRRKIAELRGLIDAVKKGAIGDPKRKVLIEGIKKVIDLAKHHAELGQADATMVQPAKAVIAQASHLTGTGPNFLSALGPLLIFLMVIDRFLNKKPPSR
jgi:hypothetical protein